MSRTKIIHIITALNTGGAEMMLYKLLSHLDRYEYEIKVITLIDIGPVGRKIESLGIPIIPLGMKRGVPNPLFIYKLARILKDEKPDIIQTWMYHANLLGLLSGKLAKVPNIIWSIRHGDLQLTTSKLLTVAVSYLSGILSKQVDKIIFNSEISAMLHRKHGYDKNRIVIFPNGFDIAQFRPNFQMSENVKSELHIPDSHYVVGLIGRWHPDKDHSTFIKAAGIIACQIQNIRFILCGEGITKDNEALISLIKHAGIEEQVHLLGRRDDIPKIMCALDLLVSSSISEGFPNVIGEAMACEVPCVVTDVGDSAYIVGDTGITVPVRNHNQLADAVVKFLTLSSEERRRIGQLARKRICENFELVKIVNLYERLYNDLIQNKLVVKEMSS